MEKLAIIGPFNSIGGREIEVGFLSLCLGKSYEVNIYSTEYVSKANDIRLINPDSIIFHRKKGLLFRLLSYCGYKNKNQMILTNLSGLKLKSLKNAIIQNDIVLIVAQLTSNHTQRIIEIASEKNKRIYFRTTGSNLPIDLNSPNYSYLKLVKLFINHSESNSKMFKSKINIDYKIIDQCVIKEDDLLKIKQNPIPRIFKFYCLGRLESLKNVDTIIAAFNLLPLSYKMLELHIIGDGPERLSLQKQARNPNIFFHGHLNYLQMSELVSNLHCLIIASSNESGPLSGIEAMLFKKAIISTRVGAMEDRILENDFMWFESRDPLELKAIIIRFSMLSKIEIIEIQNIHFKRYVSNYSKKEISSLYNSVIT